MRYAFTIFVLLIASALGAETESEISAADAIQVVSKATTDICPVKDVDVGCNWFTRLLGTHICYERHDGCEYSAKIADDGWWISVEPRLYGKNRPADNWQGIVPIGNGRGYHVNRLGAIVDIKPGF
jgi:hypothetical protein